MRTILALSVWCLLLTGCRTGNGAQITTSATTTTGTTTTTGAIVSTTSSTTSSSPSTTAAGGLVYLVTAPEGVFRVADRTASLVAAVPGVMWAADDGMGGVVYYAEPGVVQYLRATGSEPVTIATNATPNFVALIDGAPTLEISQIQQGECDDADNQHAMLVDLASGRQTIFVPCIPLESWGIAPRSIGGSLSLSIAGGGWPDEAPLSARLEFRDVHLPDSVTMLTDWTAEAFEVFADLAIEVPANPWPQECRWCTLDASLSPDGRLLAVVEFVATPADFGVTEPDEIAALPITEQWRRWEDLSVAGERTLRTIDLDSGEVLYSQARAGPGWLLDFDGRYVVYQSGGTHTHGYLIIDTRSGAEIPIYWGPTGPGLYAHVALALPSQRDG